MTVWVVRDGCLLYSQSYTVVHVYGWSIQLFRCRGRGDTFITIKLDNHLCTGSETMGRVSTAVV